MGLDTVEVVLWAEEAFGVPLPAADAAGLTTVGALATYIHRAQHARGQGLPLTEPEIVERLQTFLCERFALARERITSSARFVEDLGLDT
jgi:acyl carrier protein